MFVPYLNCLYASGIVKPYFGFHFKNFIKHLKGQNRTPFIAQESYFVVFADENIDGIIPYAIPQELEDSYLKNFSSEKDAWKALLNFEQPIYIEWLSNCFDNIEKDTGEKIEGILTYVYNPSLYLACAKRNIPVFEYEYSPIRYPYYQHTMGYLMNSNKFSKDESKNRYKNFLMELKSNNISLLSRKEIIALTFLPENMYSLYNYNENEEFELGLALGPEDDSYREVWSEVKNSFIIDKARDLFGNSILLRTHPTETENFDKYNMEIDKSSISLGFVNRCKRVATICSNVGFEGMLLGKPTYVLGQMPFSDGAIPTMDMDDDMVCSAEYINFITFCIFAPFELMHDTKYIRWRLTNPSELEIYNYNINYIITKILNLDENILEEKGGRLNRILIARGLPPFHYDKRIVNITEDETWVKKQLALRDKEIFDLEVKLAEYSVGED